MLQIQIPGFGALQLTCLVMDYNGTLAVDGRLIDGVGPRLVQLSQSLELHVVTADTFGCAQNALGQLPCRLQILPPDNQAEAKQQYVRRLGKDRTVAMGNGRNDRSMLADAALGIGLILGEGAAPSTLSAADVVCASVLDALDLLRFPKRLTATLRS